MSSSGGHNMPKSAEVAPLLQEAGGLAESCDIQRQGKIYRVGIAESLHGTCKRTGAQTTLKDYLKCICVFNISCSCGNFTASLCKPSVKQEEL